MKNISIVLGNVVGIFIVVVWGAMLVHADPAPEIIYTEAQIQVDGETVYMDGPPIFTLYGGWNLLAAPFDTPPAAIGSANPCIRSIWLWNLAAQEWNAWFPLADGMVGAVDLYEIAAGQGFWVWCQ